MNNFREVNDNDIFKNRQYVQKQLDKIDDNFTDYLVYWTEKYYRNGFVDGVQIIIGCFDK